MFEMNSEAFTRQKTFFSKSILLISMHEMQFHLIAVSVFSAERLRSATPHGLQATENKQSKNSGSRYWISWYLLNERIQSRQSPDQGRRDIKRLLRENRSPAT
jgi:hypothetical protein